MARKTVNATRMELLKGKKRAVLAKRGHKLLKDKLDGIVQRFLGLVKEYQKLKQEFEPKLVQIFTDAILVGSKMTPDQMVKIVQDNPATASLNVAIKNFMGVKIPQYEIRNASTGSASRAEPRDSELEIRNLQYDLVTTPAELDTLYLKIKDILPELIKLAQMTQTIETMVHEIIEIKRRVNALEYILIPELDETNKYITMKLSEMERSNLVSLMKIKELVNK